MGSRNKDFDNLCMYVKQIMGYDDNQKLSKNMILRLRGMAEGKAFANKKTRATAHYSFDVILLTFKASKGSIDWAIRNVNFENDTHKFNYIMRIVDSNLNTIYNKVKEKEKRELEDESKPIDIDRLENYSGNYKRQNDDKALNNRLESIW